MAKSFSAQIKNWSDKARRNIDLVVKQSAQDVLGEMTETVTGITRGGQFQEGKLPVADGNLANSLTYEINGAAVGSGAGGYTAAIAGMEMGDSLIAAFSTDYDMRIEYGFTGTDALGRKYNQPGRFFVRNAAQKWPKFVSENAARLR